MCLFFARRNRSRRTAPMPERRRVVCGGINDAPGRENDPKVIELTRFAVAEYNSNTNGMLEFERLVRVRHQLVAGGMYYSTIEVKEGDTTKVYEAKVWEQVWVNFKQLTWFGPVATETTAAA